MIGFRPEMSKKVSVFHDFIFMFTLINVFRILGMYVGRSVCCRVEVRVYLDDWCLCVGVFVIPQGAQGQTEATRGTQEGSVR